VRGPAGVTNRSLQFSSDEMVRLREACRTLNTSYVDFVRVAVLQACDEVLGTSAEYQRVRTINRPEGASGQPE
jgi:hypothetical protein